MFRTAFNHNHSINSPVGNSLREVKQLRVTETGKKYLCCIGEVNEKEKICSFARSVDLKALVRRAQNGDPFALDKRRGFFADMSGAPKTLTECYSMLSKAEDVFNNLKPDIKSNYNDFADFLHQDINKLMSYVKPVVEDPVPDGGDINA